MRESDAATKQARISPAITPTTELASA